MLGWLLLGGMLVAGPAWASSGPLLAYVDPGAGSFLLQALVAAMAGIIVTVNIYWQKIKTLLGMGSKPDDSDASGTGTNSTHIPCTIRCRSWDPNADEVSLTNGQTTNLVRTIRSSC